MRSWILFEIGAALVLIGSVGLKELADSLNIFEQGLLALIFVGMVFLGYSVRKNINEE